MQKVAAFVRASTMPAIFACTLVLAFVVRLDEPPFDDALFFRRFAVNWLSGHGFSWNPFEPPVYGNTSQLFQALLVPIVAAAPTHSILIVKVLSAICVFGSFMLLRRGADAATPGSSQAMLALAFAGPAIVWTLHSGMETALTLLCVCAFIVAIDPRTVTPRWSAPVLAFVAFTARPDTLLLTGTALLVIDAQGWTARSFARVAGLALGVFVTSGIAWCYYGTPLPLAFFVKSAVLSPYDAEFLADSAKLSIGFMAYAWASLVPLVLLAVTGNTRFVWALVVPAIAFSLYHLFLTVPVMGSYGRFHVPAVPFLAMAALTTEPRASTRMRVVAVVAAVVVFAFALERGVFGPCSWSEPEPGFVAVGFLLGIGIAFSHTLDGRNRVVSAAMLVLLAMCLSGPSLGYIARHPRFASELAVTPLRDADYVERLGRASKFRGLEPLRRCVGEDLTFFHSELGVPGFMFPRATIIDLVGLMNPAMVMGESSFEVQCRARHPEAIFLPHVYYRDLNREILTSECIRGYVRVVHSPCSLYVRKDLLARYRACGGS